MELCEINDLSQVPLVSLRAKTRYLISQMLNGIKVIPSPSGYPRDWRGLAQISRVNLPPPNSCNPTNVIIEEWTSSEATFKDLIEAFKELDRWDILYDTFPSIEDDAAYYISCKNYDKKVISTNADEDKLILTIDDISLTENGKKPRVYDAFLLFSEEDSVFANEVVNKLENEFHLKLCVKDRDLVGGVTFEHEAIMRLISERCNRLIIIVSPSFLNSPANKFFVTFAQAIGIEKGQRKIIPIIYKRLPLPPQLSYYYVLDYSRKSQWWDFWKILSKSIRSLPKDTSRNNLESVCIREIEDVDDNKLALPDKNPESWNCPKKSNTRTTDMDDEVGATALSFKNSDKFGEVDQARSRITTKYKLSIFRKVLPKSLKGKTSPKRAEKKKKEAISIS